MISYRNKDNCQFAARINSGVARRVVQRVKNVVGGGVMGLALLGLSGPVVANDTYPSSPIRIVLGFSAGGGTDAIVRTLAQHMTKTLGVNVFVENRPGANGNIAADSVARAASDGYTLLYNTSSIASSPALYGERLKYDVKTDFLPVSRTASLPIILVVPPESQFSTIEEFVAYAKENPNKLNYASAGNGNVTHLASLSFEDAVGIKGTHIPYKGEAPAMVDVMAGQVDYYFATSAGSIPAVQSGQVKALAVATIDSLDTIADVPTLHETVAENLDLAAWSGLMAPAGTPDDIIEKLNEAVTQALDDEEVLAFFANQSAQATPSTPEEYGRFLESEIEALSNVITDADLTLD